MRGLTVRDALLSHCTLKLAGLYRNQDGCPISSNYQFNELILQLSVV